LQLGCVVVGCVGRGLLTLAHLRGDLFRSSSGGAERIGVLERLGERTLRARSLRGGGVCCRLEVFGERREIADAVLELAHERDSVLAYGVEREAGWLRGDVAQDELERQEKRYGLATLCIGGGMGIATIVERV
jgi:hypothetical protein